MRIEIDAYKHKQIHVRTHTHTEVQGFKKVISTESNAFDYSSSRQCPAWPQSLDWNNSKIRDNSRYKINFCSNNIRIQESNKRKKNIQLIGKNLHTSKFTMSGLYSYNVNSLLHPDLQITYKDLLALLDTYVFPVLISDSLFKLFTKQFLKSSLLAPLFLGISSMPTFFSFLYFTDIYKNVKWISVIEKICKGFRCFHLILIIHTSDPSILFFC